MSKKQLEQAKAARDARVRILTACACAWPVKESNTPSGHAKTCPGHAEWVLQYGEPA